MWTNKETPLASTPPTNSQNSSAGSVQSGGAGVTHPPPWDVLLGGQVRLEAAIVQLQTSINSLPDAVRTSVSTQGAARDSSKGRQSKRGRTSEDGAVRQPSCAPHVAEAGSQGICTHQRPLISFIDHNDSGSDLQTASPQSPAAISPAVTTRAFRQVTSEEDRQSMQGSDSIQEKLGSRVHPRFEDLMNAMQRVDYSNVRRIVEQVAHRSPTAASVKYDVNDTHHKRFLPNIPLHPMAWPRITFDIISLIVLMLDSVYVPYIIAWNLPLQGRALSLSWAVAGFWTCDMLLNCCTGYMLGGTLVMSWKPILRRYFLGAFSFDLGVLMLDYVELAATTASDMDNASLRIIKLFRLAKVTRLVRVMVNLRRGLLARLDVVVSYRLQVYGMLGYASVLHFAGILVKLLFFIAWLCHAGSCAWYFAERRMGQHVEHTWIDTFDFGTESEESLYLHGLYWSCSAMFAGASYLPPTNKWEQAFAAVFIILSALFVTSVTSSLAAILIDSQEAQKEVKKKLRSLNAFMEQRGTPALLQIAVRTDFVARMSSPPYLTELEIPHLSMITAELQSRLRAAQYEKGLLRMPLIRIVHVLEPAVVEELCYTAATVRVSKAGEKVFAPRQEMDHAILLNWGKLHYTYEKAALPSQFRSENRSLTPQSGGLETKFSPTTVTNDTWISELALMLLWTSRGVLMAETVCELVNLSTEAFVKIVMSTPATQVASASFATLATQALFENEMLVPTDVDPGIDYDAAFAYAHSSLRKLVSIPLMNIFRWQQGTVVGFVRRKTWDDLQGEVYLGKSHLARDIQNNVYRVVRLMVLSLEDKEGMVCVQIAECRDGMVTPHFQLPGHKVEGDDTPYDAYTKLLSEEFQSLDPFIRFLGSMGAVVHQRSESFAASTKYIKSLHMAEFEGMIIGAQDTPDASAQFTRLDSTPSTSVPGMSSFKNFFTIPCAGKKRTARTPSTEDRRRARVLRSSPSVSFPNLNLYAWVPRAVFDVYAINPAETNAMLVPFVQSMSARELERMQNFRVARFPSTPSDVGETIEDEVNRPFAAQPSQYASESSGVTDSYSTL